MKCITTRIKGIYMEQILSKNKTKEFKGCSEYWDKRMRKLQPFTSINDVGINFLCGRECYKFYVKKIVHRRRHLLLKNIDGKMFKEFWEIHIGKRIILENIITSETHGGAINGKTA